LVLALAIQHSHGAHHQQRSSSHLLSCRLLPVACPVLHKIATLFYHTTQQLLNLVFGCIQSHVEFWKIWVTLLSHAARSQGVLQKKAIKQLRGITWNTKSLTRNQALAALCQLGTNL
jgi:hypothetical protein